MPRTHFQITPEQRFWRFVNKSTIDCWLWTGYIGKNGYGRFKANKDIGAHRFAYQLLKGPIPAGLFVLHRCDVRHCVNPEHLFLGTQRDNILDAQSKGRLARGDTHGSRLHPECLRRGETHPSRLHMNSYLPRGDNHYARREPWRLARGDRNGFRLHPESRQRGEQVWTAKLTSQTILEIRVLCKTMPVTQIAAMFGVTIRHIFRIKNRQAWKHL